MITINGRYIEINGWATSALYLNIDFVIIKVCFDDIQSDYILFKFAYIQFSLFVHNIMVIGIKHMCDFVIVDRICGCNHNI